MKSIQIYFEALKKNRPLKKRLSMKYTWIGRVQYYYQQGCYKLLGLQECKFHSKITYQYFKRF